MFVGMSRSGCVENIMENKYNYTVVDLHIME